MIMPMYAGKVFYETNLPRSNAFKRFRTAGKYPARTVHSVVNTRWEQGRYYLE